MLKRPSWMGSNKFLRKCSAFDRTKLEVLGRDERRSNAVDGLLGGICGTLEC